MRTLFLILAALGFATPTLAADPFAFQDGDRVVFLGGTLVEREQKYGYWELILTLKNRGKAVTFRNLGWSGDTVFGESRGGFDFADPKKGFDRLVSLTKELKPTVIVICYGHTESFEGKAGVGKFTKGLEKLLDALADTKARIVLMSPTPFTTSPATPDPKPLNANLAQYRDMIESVAKERHLQFFDLFERLNPPLWDRLLPTTNWGHTDNGLHPNQQGYLESAFALTDIESGEGTALLIAVPPDVLKRLEPKIVEKNRLFFYRWRPQNETYLFGFRKHEQGKNAAEVAQFDPLIAAAEKEIAELVKAAK